MSFSITFSPWVITETTAAINWVVVEQSLPPFDRVEYRVFRDSDVNPPLVTSNSLTGGTAVSVVNFKGTVYAEVRVYDTNGGVVSSISQFEVNNYVAPTPPDWLSAPTITPTAITLNWGAEFVSPTTTSWKIVHLVNPSTAVPLGLLPVSTYSTTVVVNTNTLNDIYIVGVDVNGVESRRSVILNLTPGQLGPTIVVQPWVVGALEAYTTFSVASGAGVQSILWSLKKDGVELDSGTTATTVLAQVKDYQGVITLDVLAVDNNDVHRDLSANVTVWNRIPKPPIISAQAVSATQIRLQVLPDPDDLTTVDNIELTGLSLVTTKPSPFVQTFVALTPATTYTFTARALNPANLPGPSSEVFSVTTFEVIPSSPDLPEPLVPGPVMSQILPWLNGDLLEFLLQFSADTRTREPGAPQILGRPATLDPFLDMVEPVSARLGDIIRNELRDQAWFDASLTIDKMADTVTKLSVMAERVAYGAVFNKG